MNTDRIADRGLLREFYSNPAGREHLKSNIEIFFKQFGSFDEIRTQGISSPAAQYNFGAHKAVLDREVIGITLQKREYWDKAERDYLIVQVEKLTANLSSDTVLTDSICRYILSKGNIQNKKVFIDNGGREVATARAGISGFLNKIRQEKFKTAEQKQYELTDGYKKEQIELEIEKLQEQLPSRIHNPSEEILALIPNVELVKNKLLSLNGQKIRDQLLAVLQRLKEVCERNHLKSFSVASIEKDFFNILYEDQEKALREIEKLITSFQLAKQQRAEIKAQIQLKKAEITAIGSSSSSGSTSSFEKETIEASVIQVPANPSEPERIEARLSTNIEEGNPVKGERSASSIETEPSDQKVLLTVIVEDDPSSSDDVSESTVSSSSAQPNDSASNIRVSQEKSVLTVIVEDDSSSSDDVSESTVSSSSTQPNDSASNIRVSQEKSVLTVIVEDDSSSSDDVSESTVSSSSNRLEKKPNDSASRTRVSQEKKAEPLARNKNRVVRFFQSIFSWVKRVLKKIW